MQVINFNGGAYDTGVADQNQQQCINWYPEEDTFSGKYEFQQGSPLLVLKPTPGLDSPFVTLAGGNVRCTFEHKGVLYAVGGNKFYSISTGGTATERGTLNTSSGVVRWAMIDDQIMIVDGTNGYNYVVSTTTFTEISDADYPDTAIQVTAQDDIFIVKDPTVSGRVAICTPSNGLSWPTTAFFNAEGHGDDVVAIISDHRELWLIGDKTTEIWLNTGAATVTFERRDGIFIEMGCQAQHSVAQGDNSLFWLAKDRHGQNAVIRIDGFVPHIISTRAISYQLSTYSTTSDAIGYIYRQAGHEFYVLTFPTAERTWVYDTTTQIWHERRSLESSSQNRWRGQYHAFFNGINYVGDYNSGKIYKLNVDTFTENGAVITRTRTTQPFYSLGKDLTVYRMQIDFETAVGSNPTVSLATSTNGGHSFSTAIDRTITTATSGDRIIWNRLGRGRDFTFRLTTTANAKIVVLGAMADFEIAKE